MEANNLEAKDANGFSDPYCMLGIVPGNRAKSTNLSESDIFVSNFSNSNNNNNNLNKMQTVQNFNLNQNAPQQQPIHLQHSSHKSSIIKRFSSFRRTEKPIASPASSFASNTIGNAKESITRETNNLNKSKSVNSNSKLNPAIRDKLPAKYIQTTDVKKATLNPVWMQKFKL